MLAKRRGLFFKGREVARTPILVPSFSSKGFPRIEEIVQFSEEFISEEILVSAYDVYYNKIIPPFDFASIIFLDSGGYEASRDPDLSDTQEHNYTPKEWNFDLYRQVLEAWNARSPTVVVSYDHPKERQPVHEQISNAKNTFQNSIEVLREILLKPETTSQQFLQIESIIENIHSLVDFSAIGVTEKELGSSVLERMENIARIRIALDKAGIRSPIHVFGSLDTITTPMYFLAGADIFDGLTWLRYAFKDGYTIYRHHIGPLELGLGTKNHLIEAQCWTNNLNYMRELHLQMRRFLKVGDFDCFDHHGDLFKKAYQSIAEDLEV